MSELISGKMAFDYAYEGIEVLYRTIGFTGWASFNDVEWSVDELRHGKFEFMLEKQTITINGIEVSAPFEPKEGDAFYYLDGAHAEGFSWRKMHDDTPPWFFENPTWRTEDEIKQVVAALRKIFVINNQ